MPPAPSAVLSNLKGSPYPEPDAIIRDQIFTTVGIFQRFYRWGSGTFPWGFAYDWLFDDYYSNFHFGQWRVKTAGSPTPATNSAFGRPYPGAARRAISLTFFGGVTDELHFKPITQGSCTGRNLSQ